MRPIISSRGAVTYESAKELSRILKPLVGRSPHHVHNTQDFIQSIEGIKLQENECIMSNDVNLLFTSIPIDPAITIIMKHLRTRQRSAPKDHHDSQSHLLSSGILFEEHIFSIQR